MRALAGIDGLTLVRYDEQAERPARRPPTAAGARSAASWRRPTRGADRAAARAAAGAAAVGRRGELGRAAPRRGRALGLPRRARRGRPPSGSSPRCSPCYASIPRFVRAQDEGRWDYHVTEELAGKRVLLVGAGDVAEQTARRLEPFDVATITLRRAPGPRRACTRVDELPDLLPEHDVVVLLVPLTDETRGLVDADFLAAMPDGALLVNAARGPVVDTDALIAELSAGRLRAAVDVTDPEPLPADHPLWRRAEPADHAARRRQRPRAPRARLRRRAHPARGLRPRRGPAEPRRPSGY